MSNGPLLSAYDLRREFDSPSGKLPVLKGVRMDLHAGRLAFIIGRSGSGKSTLLHLLGGLDRPDGGKILFEGEELTRLGERALARIRNRRIGFVFQFFHLLPELTLFENVILPSFIAGKRDKKWTEEVLKKVGLWDRRDHFPGELSGGEQQRGAIARALVNHPALVLCDEPAGNLDQETAESVFSLIYDLNKREGLSFLIVTHDEALAWRHEQVMRLVDGVLLSEERGKMRAQKV